MNEASNADIERLTGLAREASLRAYAPESGFRVGAAILASSGNIYTGSNVENASYSVSVCAERTALFTAVAAGEHSFTALAVVAEEGRADAPPCGACRQALIEFSPEMSVTYRIGGKFVVRTAAELLPDPFNRSDDGRD